tara:strand:- start:69 stop:758 length:690 start_codon:yes stop_codon:yes gene_type:complete
MENDRSLRRLAKYGGFLLAFSAGSVNISALAGIFGIPVTHLTGTISKFSLHLSDNEFRSAALLLFVLLSFMLGAVFSGYFIGSSDLKFGRKYGIVLIIQSAILLVAIPLLSLQSAWGEYTLAFSSGMQNALATTFSGAIIRSTHLTGIVTDIGVIIGNSVKAKRLVSLWQLAIHIAIVSGFVSGSVAGYFAFKGFSTFALLLPAILNCLLGVSYYLWRAKVEKAETPDY